MRRRALAVCSAVAATSLLGVPAVQSAAAATPVSASQQQFAAALAQVKTAAQARREARRAYYKAKREMVQTREGLRRGERPLRTQARDKRRVEAVEARQAQLQRSLEIAGTRSNTIRQLQLEERLSIVKQHLQELQGEAGATPAAVSPSTTEDQALLERLRSELPTLAAAVTQAETAFAEAQAALSRTVQPSAG
jgi:chromosome segregation ATPase